jgi:hypothetical protein
MHTTGVKVSIRRTITPAKYTALKAYSITEATICLKKGRQWLLRITENSLVVHIFDAVPQACRERCDQYMQVKEEGEPCCGLVLGN